MKAYRGQPEIFAARQEKDRYADLEIRDLSLNFGGVKALTNIDLKVRNGELYAVIGPNGAGKTSLMNCITGFYKPKSGRIIFNDRDITRMHAHNLVKIGIGRTFQNIELFPGMTVLANMLLARHLYCRYNFPGAGLFLPSVRREEVRHRRLIEELIDFLEIQAIRNKKVASLPYGLMKRVELGRALALEPRLLVLDEPFAGMTLEEKEDMVRFITEINEVWGQTIVLVEHDMAIVMSISHRIAVLNFGEMIAEGTADEIGRHPEVIRAYLG
ncbi:MAG: ABC transporter ATP-binding protein [Syntrophales bacterium]|jgi:branched-chain amino acid transport system ATP-binding protein|nr:ABC transporter ATP-binding protein [Syntrophales bacterium]